MIERRRFLGRAALLAAPVAVLALALGGAMLAPQALSQPAEVAPVAKPVEQATATVACITCHSAVAGHEKEHPFGKDHASHQFILLNEGATWQQSDPHSTAFKRLDGSDKTDNALAKSMGEKLGYDVANAPQCRTCHATDKKPSANHDADSDRFDTLSGVSCAACHGMSKAWQVEHYQAVQGELPWRKKTAATKVEEKVGDKVKKWGLRDLRNPAVKAKLCVSCHVGEPAEGKVVTHEMYAAGHPPLPPFELSTYQDGQPRHWARPNVKDLKFLAAMTDEKRWEHYRIHPLVGDPNGESAAARDHAVGAVAALGAEAALLEAGAIKAIDEKDALDFARFDCYACHHDLKSPSDRPKRAGDKQPPGRPPLRASIGLSASIVAEHALASENPKLKEVAAGFAANWEALQAAAITRPFGDPEKFKSAAHKMADWCDRFLKLQETCADPLYSKAETIRLAEMIRKTAEGEAASDPESAMVLTWAYLALARDIKGDQPAELQKNMGVPLAIRTAPPGKTDIDFIGRAKSIRMYEADAFRKAFEKFSPPK